MNLIPLHSWYSPSRGDNFATTDRDWWGAQGDTRNPGGYRWSGVLGYVLDPIYPEPPDTVPLYTWYDPGRRDHFLSSDPRNRPAADWDRTRPPNYRFVRLEGYAYDKPVAGTFPLQSHWSPSRKDNFATTHYSWIGDIGKYTSPDYTLYRNEGYIPAPRAKDIKPYDRDRLGIGRAKFNARSDTPIEGTRPLVVILVQNSDVRLRNTRDYYEDLFFGDPDQSVVAYYREMSRGKFEWTRAGVLGPYTFENLPGTMADESAYHCTSADRVRCPGGPARWEHTIPWVIRLAARDFDFSRYDRNRDGKLQTHELAVAYIAAHPPLEGRDTTRYPYTSATAGATRGPAHYGGPFAVRGVSFEAKVAGMGEGTSIANAAHELFHVLDGGIDNDIYGSNSYQASLMGATIAPQENAVDRFHLDPWHKMRAGWVDPLIRPILEQVPPGSAHLTAPALPTHLAPLHHPVLFFDPVRGFQDVFMVEHRMRQRFDATIPDEGLAVWFARVDDTLNPFEIPGEEFAGGTRRRWSTSRTGQTLWTVGAPDQVRGLSRFWQSSHGEVDLRWYPAPTPGDIVRSGPPSGLHVLVGDREDHGLDVEWRSNDQLFLPRIDDLRGVGGNGYRMAGDFGLPKSKVVRLEPREGGRGYELVVEHWQANDVGWRMPDGVRPGDYFVRVYTDRSTSQGGNRYPLIVHEGEGPF